MRSLLAALLLLGSLPALAGEPKPFVRGSWQAVRQAHAGRPLVVHFWGLTCGPCLAELPRWGEFAKHHPDAVVVVAADPVPMKPEAIAARLSKDGLSDAEDWMFDGFSDRLRYEVDPLWQGELPRTLLIGSDGAVTVITGAADFGEVRAWLDAQKGAG